MAEREERSRQQYEKRAKRRVIRQLHLAVKDNDLVQVEEILTPDVDVNFQYGGVSALQIAVQHGHTEMCRLLVDREADVNQKDAKYDSLLNMAAWRGYFDIVKILVLSGADMDAANDIRNTPLHTAAGLGHADIVDFLVISAANKNQTNDSVNSPLNTACWRGHQQVVSALIKGGADLNLSNHDRSTPLITATAKNHLHIMQQLISAGCDLNVKTKHGYTALHKACQCGHSDAVQLLITSGANVNITDNKDAPPLIYAVKEQHKDIIQMLADAKCDLNRHEVERSQASLHIAVFLASQYFGNPEDMMSLVRLLVKLGCDVNVVDRCGWTPLYQAAQSGASEIVDLLLSEGARVDMITDSKDTVLHASVFGNQPGIMSKLLKAGCNVNLCNIRNELPLYTAIDYRAKKEVIKLLLDSGSETDVREIKEGQSPLFCAIAQDNTVAVDLLIQAGCDINQTNKDGNSPLWMACNKGNTGIVDTLLKRPDIEINTGLSHVPLHAAAVHGYTNIALTLIKAGADVNRLSELCVSALFLAADQNHLDVLKVLLKHGANPSAQHGVKLPQKCCRTYKDRHPHMELEPLYAVMKNDNFVMFKLVIACTPRMPYYVLTTLRDLMFRTGYAQNANIPPQTLMKYAAFFSGILSTPRSLLLESRGTIRQSLPGNPSAIVHKLPLPSALKDFVAMTEFLPD